MDTRNPERLDCMEIRMSVAMDSVQQRDIFAHIAVQPPRKTRFGSPLVLSRVYWVEPKLVAEITYLTWAADNLLRHTIYIGLREDKPSEQVWKEGVRS
jgi:bifunctional non-homologous end joining protein LigD